MLAMQYSVRLPEDFDVEQVYQHVSMRSRLFEGRPGLRHKFYLYDAEDHIYAPFYIWENSQVAQDFLFDNLFSGVIETFGRPRVRSWQIVDFDYGSSSEEPTFLRSAIDKVPSQLPLGKAMEKEKQEHQDTLGKPGLFAHMVLLDPDRWEIGRFGLWRSREEAVPTSADCIHGFDVLKVNQDLQGAA
ncbi:MAG: hypothetical protein COB93_05785 [Sneathiella sp.]|nr:MAG: hypothetical protein COB93_05785 [Sneathiella sp.]